MSTVKFSKTRIVYYENEWNAITSSTIGNLPISNVDANQANKAYRIVTQPGDGTNGHNWHTVPINKWGLYVTPAEFYSLYENNDSFTPVEINITIGHAIPIARYASTTNSTQLSFNNTIYSLIYDLQQTDMVTHSSYWTSPTTATNFFRSFDGADYANNQRVLLPKTNILFKIPYQMQPYESGATEFPRNNTYPVPQNITWDTSATTTTVNVQPMSDAELINSYYPEFLQDNSNVKALYPGENQDVYVYNNENNKHATIDTNAMKFGEMWQNLDLRNFGMNSDYPFPEGALMDMFVYPQIRGPIYQSDGSLTSVNGNTSEHIRFENYKRFENNYDYSSYFTDGMPKKFIKGIPILDGTNALVPHSFCATMTWTITVKVNPRHTFIPRPLRYGHANTHVDTVYTSNTTWYNQQVYKKSWPRKPLPDSLFKDTTFRYIRSTVRSADDEATFRNADFGLTANNLPAETEEVESSVFRNPPRYNQPTKTFHTAPASRRITRSMTRKTVESMIADAMHE